MSDTRRGTPGQLTRRGFLAALGIGGAATLAGCGLQTAGTDAVAVGGDFTFVSPGGQMVITYPEAERQPIGHLFGPDLMDPDAEIDLQRDFAGQVVVLNAWGQWCPPCRAEADDLQRVHEQISPRGATVLGINVRDQQIQAAQDFHTDAGLEYPSIYDPPFKSALALGGIPASVIPTTVVLDRQHRPAVVFLKAISDTEVMEHVTPLLDEA